jgi:peptidyl-tRNA hydrolase, PTH1 family
LIVGLGNPGPGYRDTRHNLGFRLVERLAERWRLAEAPAVCRSRVWRDAEVVLAQPQTYMNRSGWAVACLRDLHAVAPDRLLVAFDDVALPLGALRLRPRGGAGGHRGLESVLASLESEAAPRLRLGIAPAGGAESLADLSAFVLAPFGGEERATVEDLLERAVEAVEVWRVEGIEAAMNRSNR